LGRADHADDLLLDCGHRPQPDDGSDHLLADHQRTWRDRADPRYPSRACGMSVACDWLDDPTLRDLPAHRGANR